jgi:hypothetical protein
MMILYWHTPIIPYHIDIIFFNPSRRKIPVTRKSDIRFFHLLPVNKKFPITKFNEFILLGDHSFKKHYLAAGKAYCYDIIPFRFGKKIAQPPTKIYPSVGIGWLHTYSLNGEGNTQITKKEVGKKSDQADPDQKLRCE